MATIPSKQLQRIGILTCLVVSGFLVAHSINAFVAEALFLPPERSFGSAAGTMALPVSYSPGQLAEDVRASGLFLLPPDPLSLATQGGATGMPVRASIGVAAKLRLIGVVIGAQRGRFAIVEELSTKKQVLYHLHDQIPDLGEVSEIKRDGMMVRQGDQEEFLELGLSEKPAPAVSVPGAAASQVPSTLLRKVVDRREVEQAMSDLPKLLTQARAVPNMVNGAVNGFRIDYIAPASFYEKIGVQAGDVLQRVNGVDIRDPSTMLSLLQQLKNERVVKLDMVRNNQRSTVTYELR